MNSISNRLDNVDYLLIFFFFFPLSQYGIFSMTVQDFAASEREEIHVCSELAKEIQVSLLFLFLWSE